MQSIKFSHEYQKLWGQLTAELIAIRMLDAQAVAINKTLIEYDTRTLQGEYYPLPQEGKLIQLIFIGNRNIPFCTLRRYTPEKFAYYTANAGKMFKIDIGSNEKG